MIIFIDVDDAYLHWIDQNSTGFVVNSRRRPTSKYLILHRATCSHISGVARTNWTTDQYIKVCAADLKPLENWARDEVGGELKPCGVCCKVLKPLDLLSLAPEPASASVGDVQAWKVWRPKTQLAENIDLVPLKASWEKSTDPSQVRLRDYRLQVRESLLSALGHDCL